jgi:hypothetical protein
MQGIASEIQNQKYAAACANYQVSNLDKQDNLCVKQDLFHASQNEKNHACDEQLGDDRAIDLAGHEEVKRDQSVTSVAHEKPEHASHDTIPSLSGYLDAIVRTVNSKVQQNLRDGMSNCFEAYVSDPQRHSQTKETDDAVRGRLEEPSQVSTVHPFKIGVLSTPSIQPSVQRDQSTYLSEQAAEHITVDSAIANRDFDQDGSVRIRDQLGEPSKPDSEDALSSTELPARAAQQEDSACEQIPKSRSAPAQIRGDSQECTTHVVNAIGRPAQAVEAAHFQETHSVIPGALRWLGHPVTSRKPTFDIFSHHGSGWKAMVSQNRHHERSKTEITEEILSESRPSEALHRHTSEDSPGKVRSTESLGIRPVDVRNRVEVLVSNAGKICAIGQDEAVRSGAAVATSVDQATSLQEGSGSAVSSTSGFVKHRDSGDVASATFDVCFDEDVKALGLTVHWLANTTPQHVHVFGPDRCEVTRINPEGDAWQRGIRSNDVIVACNNALVNGRSHAEVLSMMGQRPLTLRIHRLPRQAEDDFR